MDVYLLWHEYEFPAGVDHAKLIGVYASHEAAAAARMRVLPLPGFREWPDCFEISRMTVGVDQWTEGFIKCSET